MAKPQVRIIGGVWRRRVLPVLEADGLRPTPDRVRETVFNWLGQSLNEQSCLDLFAGSGALGFEAASRGARVVVLVEQNVKIVRQLVLNQQLLAADQVQIIHMNALSFLQRYAGEPFDVVFLDPPFQALDLLLSAIQAVKNHVQDQGYLYIETCEKLTLQQMGLRDWSIFRYDKAGQVHYYLLRKTCV